jgi:hypothetical protein
MSDSKPAPGLDPDILHRALTVEAETVHIDNMKHQASVHGFTFFSDEPPTLEGDDEYPYPLDYLTASIGL